MTSTELAELNEDGEPASALVSTMMLKLILGPEGQVELEPVPGKKKDSDS